MTRFMAVPNRGQVLPFLDPKQLWRVIPSSCDRRGALTQKAPKPRSQKKPRTSAIKSLERNGEAGISPWEHSLSECVLFIGRANQAQIQSQYRHRYSPACSCPPSKMRKKFHRQYPVKSGSSLWSWPCDTYGSSYRQASCSALRQQHMPLCRDNIQQLPAA